MDGYSYLTFDQRREIEVLYSDGDRVVDIAAKIGRSVAAIYEELKRGYTGELDENKRPVYSADLAQTTAQENIRRKGNRRAANQYEEGKRVFTGKAYQREDRFLSCYDNGRMEIPSVAYEMRDVERFC